MSNFKACCTTLLQEQNSNECCQKPHSYKKAPTGMKKQENSTQIRKCEPCHQIITCNKKTVYCEETVNEADDECVECVPCCEVSVTTKCISYTPDGKGGFKMPPTDANAKTVACC